MFIRHFSQHFVQRWVEWRGHMPNIEEVNALIDGGQQTRPQLKLLQRCGQEGLKEYLLLAEFWKDEAGVIVRVDEYEATAVTLICAGRKKQFRRVRKGQNEYSPPRAGEAHLAERIS